MNNRQKEILQSQLNSEEEVLKKLKGIYKKALDDIDDNIAALMGRTDTENLQSIIYQLQYQNALKTQINGILDTLQAEQFTTIADYLSKCYEQGYLGTMYDLQGQGIPLIMPIDQNQVVRALQNDSKLSKSLYDSLGEDVSLLKKRVQNNISRGIAQGASYANIARNIASGMVGDYSKMRGGALSRAYTIARTEGHRIQNEAAFDAQQKAKEKGADIVKQWDSTLDGRTRDSHRRVDGEIRELDEKFSNGLMFPGDPNGAAGEVINCRCALLQMARSELEDGFTKYNGFTGEIETFNSPKDYDEFKAWYFSEENTEYMKYVSDLEKKYGTKNLEKLLNTMSDSEYQKFYQLESMSPMWNTYKREKYIDALRNVSYNDNDIKKIGLQFFAESDVKRQTSTSLRRGIRKYNKVISVHEDKIAHPEQYCSDWDSFDDSYKAGLKRHWEKEIRTARESIEVRIEELKGRGEDYE